jgi:hypothetical protein
MSFSAMKLPDGSRITGVNDWEEIILKYHLYYRSRNRRRIKWLIAGLFLGVILERNLWHYYRR